MKSTYILCAAATLALLSGCSRGANNSSANAAANASTSTNSAIAAPAAPGAAAAGAPVTQAALVGTWGQDNCANTMTFNADGTATSTGQSTDNVRWTLAGSTIVITAPGQPEARLPATINGDTLNLGNGAGQSAPMTRCPAPAAGAADANSAAASENASEKAE